jgi:phospholipid/cholesterol/gamma-HCH transport system permease protein
LMLPHIEDFTAIVLKEIPGLKLSHLDVKLDQLENIDSAGVTALFYVKKKLKDTGVIVNFEGGSKVIKHKMELFSSGIFEQEKTPEIPGVFENTGAAVSYFFSSYVYGFINLAADIFYYAGTDIFKSRARRKGEFINQSVLIGVNAAPIVVFMAFIIGLVLALQSSQQLRNFGANIYIVDLTVIAMMSQMGPLITAVLVAGRSGSAIAAEIATMKVTSELDALKTMGLNPIRFVVIPKLYACLLTMPFLIILANISGIAGGGMAAWIYLDITPEIFVNRMGNVLVNKDLITGFVKSQAYASLIVLTGSFYGFRVVRGAEGVGKATTAAVVVAISLVIVADSILGLLFYN